MIEELIAVLLSREMVFAVLFVWILNRQINSSEAREKKMRQSNEKLLDGLQDLAQSHAETANCLQNINTSIREQNKKIDNINDKVSTVYTILDSRGDRSG